MNINSENVIVVDVDNNNKPIPLVQHLAIAFDAMMSTGKVLIVKYETTEDEMGWDTLGPTVKYTGTLDGISPNEDSECYEFYVRGLEKVDE